MLECRAVRLPCAQDSSLPRFHHSRGNRRRGVALLMVLMIVMAITVISMGFVARMDGELACGGNTLLRMQMDQLARSGLEHARGLVLHPQDVPLGFWTNGATSQQLIAASQDYYEVSVARDTSRPLDYCTYDVTCEAYRLSGSDKTARSRLAAKLRLDPCVALEVGTNTTLWSGVNISGDVYAKNSLVNNAAIDGDVFAASYAGTGTRTGQLNPQTLALTWPPVTAGYLNPHYPVRPIAGPTLPAATYAPDSIWLCTTDLAITGTVQIRGMLLVRGNLTIQSGGTASRIIAARHLPALYVSGNLVIEDVHDLQIEGLAVVDHDVCLSATASNITVTGGLFVGGTLNGPGSALTIVVDPRRAAIVHGVPGSETHWSPAAGGFYGSMERQ
jgi:cytoskeletal protein CcmA (bactofilin family)